MSKTIKLSQLKKGDSGHIYAIESDELRANLLELGLTIGSEIHYLYCAPLGDPIAVNVQGFVLSMRKSEAELVSITPFHS